jgi:hypothetical protein
MKINHQKNKGSKTGNKTTKVIQMKNRGRINQLEKEKQAVKDLLLTLEIRKVI